MKQPAPETGRPQTVVLAVGKDPMLLEIRSQLLRSDGYTVTSALSIKKALALFVAGDFDLVVLCHTIPATERGTLVQALRDHSPSTAVVLVSSGFEWDSSVDATIENEPKQLLQELPKLLHKQSGISSGRRIANP